MVTIFENKVIKGITTYILVLCLVVNLGLASLNTYNNRLKKHKTQTRHRAIAIQTESADDTRNQPGKINQENNIAAQKNKHQASDDKLTVRNRVSGVKHIPISPGQFRILVRLVNAEAGGEPFKGQVAVAAVLLNRIRSGKFPQSISANVFRNGEFESVSNGYIWNTNPTASAYKAAVLALKGWDPTAGSLYFYNPAKTTSRWIWSRPIYTIIGKHYFAG